jgi:hypothetical protein
MSLLPTQILRCFVGQDGITEARNAEDRIAVGVSATDAGYKIAK